MSKHFRILVLLLVVLPFTSFSQVVEQTGWLASFTSAKFSDKWGLHLDVQLRSADDLSYAKNLLVRPGLTYFINDKQNVTAGYALVKTYANPDVVSARNFTEHRIWQQYIVSYKIGSVPLMHRFRLEQRFIETASDDVFSQRGRYFVRGIIPIAKKAESFSKGMFVGLQNELFLNLQNKDEINNSTFDQNRAYIALGYRLSKKVDLEAGYLNQYVKGAASNLTNHVTQLAVYSRF